MFTIHMQGVANISKAYAHDTYKCSRAMHVLHNIIIITDNVFTGTIKNTYLLISLVFFQNKNSQNGIEVSTKL